jgi:hypothetical protein
LHDEKENFEEYSLILESAELSFAILINYSARKWQTCPRTTVYNVLNGFSCISHIFNWIT